MTRMSHILIVDDDPHIRDLLAFALGKAGMSVAEASDGEDAQAAIARRMPDLMVLDINMPRLNGLDLCRMLRAEGGAGAALPILFLSSRDDEIDRIVGIEIGGDDYVVKPFSPRELAARVKVILRRAAAGGVRQHAPETGSFAFAGWVLKSGERTLVDRDGVSVPLSTGEYNLLHALVTRPRQVLTRDQLLDLTQGREAAAFDRAIDNQVSRLRRKIEADPKAPDLIKTVWGGGYTLAAEVTRL